MAEAGILQAGATPVIVDINEPVGGMNHTKLCAGIGSIVPSKVQHFQDSIDDLVLPHKRFRLANEIVISVGPGTTAKYTASYSEMLYVAAGVLPNYYKLFRGSINARIRVDLIKTPDLFNRSAVDLNLSCHFAGINPSLSPYGKIGGESHFQLGEEASITIPYLERTFTSPFNIEEDKTLQLEIVNHEGNEMQCVVRTHLAVGDDFHVGMFIGSPQFALTDKQSFSWQQVQKSQRIYEVVTKPEAGILGAISDIAIKTALPIVNETVKGLELDAEMDTINPDPVRFKNQQFSVPCDLPQITERLLTTNHNGMNLPDKECFGTSTNETSIHNLMTNTKSYIARFTWQMAATKGTQLYAITMGPQPPETSFGNVLHYTIPSLFYYYTGGTIVIFDIVSSEMHTGQLLISANYSWGSTSVVPAYKDVTQTYFTSFNLSKGRGTTSVWIPYLAPYPWTSVAGDTGPTGSVPTTTCTLSVFVQGPLRGSTTVASSVDVNVYTAYSKDFRLGIYGNYSSIPAPTIKRAIQAPELKKRK